MNQQTASKRYLTKKKTSALDFASKDKVQRQVDLRAEDETTHDAPRDDSHPKTTYVKQAQI